MTPKIGRRGSGDRDEVFGVGEHAGEAGVRLDRVVARSSRNWLGSELERHRLAVAVCDRRGAARPRSSGSCRSLYSSSMISPGTTTST